MSSKLEPLKFANASNVCVRLKSFDGEMSVVVSIERRTIHDLFNLSSSAEKQRVTLSCQISLRSSTS